MSLIRSWRCSSRVTLLSCLLLSCLPRSVAAQTVIISDASTAAWQASPDNGTMFGTPPAPVLTNYQGEVWLKATPTGTPVLTFNLGKPIVDATGSQASAPLKGLPGMLPNVEYVMSVKAVGPGGVSASTPLSPPFGFPSAPRAAGSAVRITP